MKLSTKGRYATRIMCDLAVHYDKNRPVTVQEISRRQEITVDYIRQLLMKLSRAGLARSVRGPKGGFMLTRKPEKIKVGDIVTTAEGFIDIIVDCTKPDITGKKCPRAEFCVARMLWKKLGEQIKEILDSYTLEDLCIEHRKLEKKEKKFR